MQALWTSLFMVFLLELGDKTQLLALTLATRFNARIVLLGIFAATLVVHVVSVVLGVVVGGLLPTDWMAFLAGLAFIGFGAWTVRGDSLDEEDEAGERWSPFWVVSITFFLAELGDKSMLSTVTLATEYSALWVWIGSTVGMVISDALAIWIGQVLGTQLPEKAIKIGASAIFFGFGLLKTVEGARQLSPAAVTTTISAVLLVTVAVWGYLRTVSKRKSAMDIAVSQPEE